MSSLSSRFQSVLYAVVTEYIGTGEPVGSRTLSAHYGLGLSAASIRNVLKDLEEEGFLSQPHKSAGRIPTRSAYQLFIDALMRLNKISPDQEGRIRELFDSELNRPELFREAGRLLSELGGVPAIVLQARSEMRAIQKIRFIATRPGELLSVIVLDDGSVENRFITLEQPLSAERLERVHLLLDEVTEGRTLNDLMKHLHQVVKTERAEVRELGRFSEGLLGAALESSHRSTEVIVEGSSSLLSLQPDPGAAQRLLVALEDREQLVCLLEQTLSSNNVQVFLGEEGSSGDVSPLSLVAASYRATGPAAVGALGVLGPTRMNYPSLVPLVGAMAGAMEGALRSEEEVENEQQENSNTD